MNSRVKSFLILGCTLMVGIIIGILGTSTWQHRRNVTLSETRIQGGLLRHIERIIDIENEGQRTEVKAVIRRTEQSFMRQHSRMVDSLSLYHEHLMTDLKQILSSDQWERLESRLARKREMRRKRHRPHRRDSSEHRRKMNPLQ